MKKIISLLLLFTLNVHAETCDWKLGITPGPNKTFIYSEACHQAVGALIQSNKDLTQAIDLKNLALTNADARTALWQKSADDEMDRLNKIGSDQKRNEWLFFGLGVLTVFGAGYVASRVYR